MIDTHRRSIVKALSWRVLAAIITTSIVWGVTGKLAFAATIGALDTLVKLAVYYAHERAWNKIDFGRVKPPEYQI